MQTRSSVFPVCLLTMLVILLSACGVVPTNNQPPANAITITMAYSPEKEDWLTERIK